MYEKPMLRSDLPELRDFSRGKVRDIYDLGDSLLFVASDRISAFDVVMAQGIPGKGKILTALTLFWLDKLGIRHHVIAHSLSEMPEEVRKQATQLKDRVLQVKKLNVFPVECIVRGYLAGSGFKSYKASGEVCGVKLPPGLREADMLPEPIFTPTTKAETGHDEDMTFEQMSSLIGKERAQELRNKSIQVYQKAREFASERGVILCDTKFEWGVEKEGEEALLADEVLTPDSSRFWPGDEYRPGTSQPSFDKQFLRDWLESTSWNKKPPPPHLPPEVVEGTRKRYFEIYERITGKPFGGS